MSFIISVFKELLSLFVDDGSLALQVLGLIVVVAVLVKGAGVSGLIGAALLLVGCLVILTLSLRRMVK
ncbi:hypothetical protein GALL_491690 [mine drainage metagenome]|uniref:Uncharacterized protein n=1 Tax=mine drainage metagenome TaxID=410659 RepID=A0A1J5PDD5_9ZZZZ